MPFTCSLEPIVVVPNPIFPAATIKPLLVTPVNAPLVNVGFIYNPVSTSLFAAATKVGWIIVDCATPADAVWEPPIVCLLVVVFQVKFALPPNADALLNCICVSAPPGVPPEVYCGIFKTPVEELYVAAPEVPVVVKLIDALAKASVYWVIVELIAPVVLL